MHGLPTLYLIHAYDNIRKIPLPDGAPIPKNTSVTLTIKNTSNTTVSAVVSTTLKLANHVTNPCIKTIAAYNTRTFSFIPVEDGTLNDFVMRTIDEVREDLNSRKRDREETDSHKQLEREAKRKCSESKGPVRSSEEKEKEVERESFGRKRFNALKNRIAAAKDREGMERRSFGRRRFNALRNPAIGSIENEENEKEKEAPQPILRTPLVPMPDQIFQRVPGQISRDMEEVDEPVEAYREPVRSNETQNEGRSRFDVLLRFIDTQTGIPIPSGDALMSGREVGVEMFNPSDRSIRAICYVKRSDGSRVDPQFNTMTIIPENKSRRLFNFTPKKEDGTLILEYGVVSFVNTNLMFHSRLFANVQ